MFKLLLLKLQQSFLRNNINISFIFSIKIICSLLLWLIHTSLMEPCNMMVYLFLTLILLLMYSSLLHFLNHVCNFFVILEQTTICFLIQVFSCLWPNVYNKYEYSRRLLSFELCLTLHITSFFLILKSFFSKRFVKILESLVRVWNHTSVHQNPSKQGYDTNLELPKFLE